MTIDMVTLKDIRGEAEQVLDDAQTYHPNYLRLAKYVIMLLDCIAEIQRAVFKKLPPAGE